MIDFSLCWENYLLKLDEIFWEHVHFLCFVEYIVYIFCDKKWKQVLIQYSI